MPDTSVIVPPRHRPRLSAHGVRPVWQFALYPDAFEGGGCWGRPTVRLNRSPAGSATDPEASARAAARRARAKVRRYCAANGLTRLGTLTYAGEGCHEPAQVRSDLGVFFRALREALGGKPLPYVWVPEWHPGGHGLHAHFAVGRRVPWRLLTSVWGHGFTHITLLRNQPVGSGPLTEARTAARYLSKYVAKTFGDAAFGRHRYDVAQGFQPESISLTAASLQDLLDDASELMSARPSMQHHFKVGSSEQPGVWAAWGR